MLADALPVRDKSRFWDAELYRLKGELLLAQEGSRLQAVGSRVGTAHQQERSTKAETVGDAHSTREAETCFLKAIEIAQRQQAKSLELRAAVSLARLWQQQGKKKEAHELLSDIYGWFTEDFNTADLKDAEALLGQLA